jgi:hypothetical protein
LREAIEDIARGGYSALIVTESSRLDRREDLDTQAEILLAIRSAGGDIISIAEPQFGRTDFAGRIVTLVAQHANAEKSRTVKTQTYRGIAMVIANKAHHGKLPTFWAYSWRATFQASFLRQPGSRYRPLRACCQRRIARQHRARVWPVADERQERDSLRREPYGGCRVLLHACGRNRDLGA